MSLLSELAEDIASVLRMLYRLFLEWFAFKPDSTSPFYYDIHSAYPYSQSCGNR